MVWKHQFFSAQPSLFLFIYFFSAFFMVQLSHRYITTGQTIALTIWTFVTKVMSLLFNMLSRFVIAFIPRSKRLLISWLQSVSQSPSGHGDFGAQENKICHCFHFSPIYLPWNDGIDARILVFWMLSFKPAFSFSSFTLIKRLFSSSSLSALEWCHLHVLGCWYFSWQSFFFFN